MSTPRERIAAIEAIIKREVESPYGRLDSRYNAAAYHILSEIPTYRDGYVAGAAMALGGDEQQAPRDECPRSSDGKHTLVAYGPHKGWCFDCGASPEAVAASRAPAPQADALREDWSDLLEIIRQLDRFGTVTLTGVSLPRLRRLAAFLNVAEAPHV